MSEQSTLGVPTTLPPSAADEVSPVRDSSCPRCGHSIRYEVCPSCRLRVNCKSCHVRLSDPLHQSHCDLCGVPVDQPPAPEGLNTTAVAAEPAQVRDRSTTATPPPLEFAIESVMHGLATAGGVRYHAAGYAAGLIGLGRARDASRLLSDALEESGDSPSAAELRLLRAHCAQVLGKPGPAIRDALEAIAEDRSLLPAVAPSIHGLLTAADAHSARSYLLRSWVARTGEGLDPDGQATVAALELHAAVLEHQTRRAIGAFESALAAAGEIGAEACRQLLLQIRIKAPAEAPIFSTLAYVEAQAGLRREAIADAERAVEIGMTGEEARKTEAELLEFRARLLEAEEEPEAAAAAYGEAGERASLNDDYEAAARLLACAVSLPGSHAVTYWQLADALRMQARTVEDRGERLSLLERAQQAWESGVAAIAAIDSASAWALEECGLIHAELADLKPEQGRRHLAEAILALERRVLLDGGTHQAWNQLAESYFGLDLFAASREAANNALEYDSDDAWALMAKAQAELAVDHADAADTLGRLLAVPGLTVLQRGTVLFFQRRYDESIPVLESCLTDPADEVSALRVLVLALGAQGRIQDELERLEALWGYVQAKDPRTSGFGPDDIGWLACQVGRYGDAIERLSPLRDGFDQRALNAGEVMGTLALAHLAQGEIEQARELIAETLARVRSAVDVGLTARVARRLAEQASLDLEAARIASGFADDLDSAQAHLRKQGLDVADAIAALREEREAEPEIAGSWPSATNVALSRLLLVGERWREAAEECLEIAGADGTIAPPEQAAILERFERAADGVATDNGSDATGLLDRALQIASLPQEAVASLEARRAVLFVDAGDNDAAARSAARTASLGPERLAAILRRLVPDAASLRKLQHRRVDLRIAPVRGGTRPAL